jgi:hypothetical protein
MPDPFIVEQTVLSTYPSRQNGLFASGVVAALTARKVRAGAFV